MGGVGGGWGQFVSRTCWCLLGKERDKLARMACMAELHVGSLGFRTLSALTCTLLQRAIGVHEAVVGQPEGRCSADDSSDPLIVGGWHTFFFPGE